MEITKNNFGQFIGQNVDVEIFGYEAAMMYPDENKLVSYYNGSWVFSSPEIEAPVEGLIKNFWTFTETEGWSINIKLKN